MHSVKMLAALPLSLLLAAGCGGGGDERTLPPAAGGGGGGGPTYDASTATGTISGSILFEGTPPEMPLLPTTADPKCPPGGVRSEEVTVTDDGLLENTIVYLRSGYDEAMTYPVPSEHVSITQQNCHYIPHVLTMMANQDIDIINGDDTLHNIHAFPMTNMVINFGQARQGMTNTETFALPEMPIPVRCDVHRWMASFIGVFDHPFHTTSGSTGMYSINVPPGTYEVVAWHERYGEQVVGNVEVADGQTAEVNFTYSAE